MEKKKLLRASIGLLILFLIPMSAYAFSPSIENGITWLSANQNSDGSWGNNADLALLDTSTVLDTFKSLNIGSPAYSNGVGWLSSQSPLSTDFISRKVISLSLAGIDVSSDLSMLLTMRSLDGGWGIDADGASDVLDTLLAERALRVASALDNTQIPKILGFVVANQNADGGFSFLKGMESNIYMTSLVLISLAFYQTTYNVATNVDGAVHWVLTHQNADGSFGGSLFETALAYSALIRATRNPQATDAASGYIRSAQRADGSWNANAFETALALRALMDAQPNLTLGTGDIVFNPSAPYEGDSVNISATIRNTGPVSAKDVLIRFFAGANKVGEQTITEIASGGIALAQISWPTTGYAGANTVTVVVDPENTIAELVETDNQASAAITVVTSQADLITLAEHIYFSPQAPTVGDIVTIIGLVGNQGATAVTNVGVALYEDAVSPANLIGALQTIPSIAPAVSGQVQVTWATAGKAGQHTIYLVADPNNAIPELNEGNNIASASIVVAEKVALPDLAITAMGFSNNWPNLNETITITAEVTNKGLAIANTSTLRFYDGEPGGAGTITIGDGTISSLAPGATGSAQVVWQATTAGGHKIYVKADPDNTIVEGNEGNNAGYAQLNVGTLPDFAITGTDVTVSHTDLTQGLQVTITALVHNIGSAPAAAKVNFYEGEPQESNLIGQADIASIEPQGTQPVTITWYPPAGDVQITVKVDPDNTVPELHEENNTATKEAIFTFPETTMKLYKITGDQRVEAYTYGAYELMEIAVVHSWENVGLLVTIEDTTGNIYIPHMDGEKILWSTSHVSPGDYRVKLAIITQAHTPHYEGTVVERKEIAFAVAPTFALKAIGLQTDPAFTFVKTAATVTIAASLRNGSNISGDIGLHYQLLAPGGGVLREGTKEITLTPDQMNLSVDMDRFDYTFGEAGDYTIAVEALYGGTSLGSTSRTLTVLPEVRIDVQKGLSPQNLYPTEEGKTKATIELKGEDASQGP